MQPHIVEEGKIIVFLDYAANNPIKLSIVISIPLFPNFALWLSVTEQSLCLVTLTLPILEKAMENQSLVWDTMLAVFMIQLRFMPVNVKVKQSR